MDLLESATKIAAADSESEVNDMMRDPVFKNGKGSDRSREEPLEDVSLNLICDYLDFDYAVRNTAIAIRLSAVQIID